MWAFKSTVQVLQRCTNDMSPNQICQRAEIIPEPDVISVHGIAQVQTIPQALPTIVFLGSMIHYGYEEE